MPEKFKLRLKSKIENKESKSEKERDFSPDVLGFEKLDSRAKEIIKKVLEIAPDSFWNKDIKKIEYKEPTEEEIKTWQEKMKDFGLKDLPVAYHTEDSIIFPKKEGWNMDSYKSLFPHVLLHEDGHFEYKKIAKEDKKNWHKIIEQEKPFSKEVKRITGTDDKSKESKGKQDFAETFAYFLLEPNYLKDNCPERYKFCEKWFEKRFPDLDLEEIRKRKEEYFSLIDKLK